MKLKSLFAASLFALAAHAQEPATNLSDAEVETRAEAIQKTLRCVVCQNQSIADSNSTLAEDMRNLVEHRVRLGDSDQEVRDYMQARYGDFVLMTPPVKPATWALWFSPLILLAGGGVWYLLNVRTRPRVAGDEEADLTPEEAAKLKSILDQDNTKA